MSPDDDVVARIDPAEVVELALALGNIDSPTGSEGAAGQYVYDWLAENTSSLEPVSARAESQPPRASNARTRTFSR